MFGQLAMKLLEYLHSARKEIVMCRETIFQKNPITGSTKIMIVLATVLLAPVWIPLWLIAVLCDKVHGDW